ncbi:MAG: hypothetical protein QOD83_671, partial [Solirubrobacteraceae bacterium]|nr:hypothetical protein [Solirubrobacteraceae bacterium]
MIHTSSPRHLARRSVLVAGAVAGTVAIAMGITSASATAAPDTCTVNSVPVAGAVVTGTAGNDTIDCANAAGARTILGVAGNDTITGSSFDDNIDGG